MDSASLEQMNKLRKSLGLPLLNVPGATSDSTASTPSLKKETKPVQDGLHFKPSDSYSDSDEEPASTLETREAAGYENFKKVQEEERKRIEREKRKRNIQRVRDAQARVAKLEGKGLGEAEDTGEQDAKAWLKGQKSRQKAIAEERARRVEQEQAEREKEAQVQYTHKDLAGVQVAHEIGDFEDGIGEQILTLQDQAIGDHHDDGEDEDVLENAEIVAKDKLNDKLKLKKKIAYDVHGDQEGLLSQYDEKKRKTFTLDESGGGQMFEERESKRMAIGDRLKDMVSLDILKAEPINDYQEVKIKKPKKTRKNKRVRDADEDDFLLPTGGDETHGGDRMEVDRVETKPRPQPSTNNFNDDDDLATALNFTRRANLKKQKRKVEDIVKQLKQEESEDAMPSVEGGLTVDDTTTFLDQLAARPPDEQTDVVQKSIEKEKSPVVKAEEGSLDEEMPDLAKTVVAVEDDEEALLDRLRREQSANTPEVSQTGLEAEKQLDQGMGSALNLLRQRGLVKETGGAARNQLYRDRQKFMVEQRLREHEGEQKARAQRERDRASGKMAHMSVREREEHARWQNTQREHHSSIAAAAAFNKEYKPDVNLKYVDEDGRLMNQKEAFKHLSHQFHGKGSGKGKTEKHLKKIEEEKKREARSVLDNSREAERGYEGAAKHQRKGGQAGVRLQ